jgi:integrase/recombinase XerD
LTKFLIENEYSVKIEEISKIELKEYLEAIASLKPKSIKRKIATIKALFNFLEYEDKIMINPFRKMKISIRDSRNLPTVMNITEINELFKVVYGRKKSLKFKRHYTYKESLRNIVVIELLFATGARVSEIANLKAENINLSTGVLKINGKGRKERVIQICNQETLKILRDYYHFWKKRIISSEGFFLLNRLGNNLSEQSIRNTVKHISTDAGIQKRITPHVFRHTFATLLLEKDVDIKYIQSLLGHSSIMTTQIYTHVNSEKQREILRTKHPRKDFSMKFR